jgi:hypothetical protein
MYRRAESRLRNACANEANQRFVESQAAKRAVDVIKERQESAACNARAQTGAQQEGQKAEACARELLTRDPKMQTAAVYEGVAACMQATGGSAQAAISNAPAPAPAPAQVSVATPAPPASAPASPQNAAAPAAAPNRAVKTQACVDETLKKLGPNALSDVGAFQNSLQDCLKR